MAMIQTLLQTIWASVLLMGWVKVAIVVLIVAIISRFQPLLGMVAALLFIAYLAQWI